MGIRYLFCVSQDTEKLDRKIGVRVLFEKYEVLCRYQVSYLPEEHYGALLTITERQKTLTFLEGSFLNPLQVIYIEQR